MLYILKRGCDVFMQILHNQRVAIKILCIISTILLFSLIVGFAGLYASREIAKNMRVLYEERTIPIELMDAVRFTSKDTESKLLQLIMTRDKNQQQELIRQIDTNTATINNLQEQYKTLPFDDFQTQKWQEIETSLSAYRQTRSDIIKLAVADKQEEAFSLYISNKAVFEKTLLPRQELIEYSIKQGAGMYETSNRLASFSSIVIIGVTLIAILVSALLGLFLSHTISYPLKRMMTTVEFVANGDFQDRPRTFRSQDEFGTLADTIVKMRTDLRSLVGKILHSSEQVAASSEELTATVEHSSQNAQQATAAIQSIASNAKSQVNAVNNTSSIVGNISASVGQLSQAAGKVTQTAETTSQAATDGLDALNLVILQMKKIDAQVANSSEIITSLGDRSKDISQIIETISGIANQTNLLALNAAIEAARAGTQGRGFAVVADEVRKLAEQSEIATKKISSLIQKIQQDTMEAVQSMEKGTHEVKTGSLVVDKAGDSFQKIAAAIHEISVEIKNVAATLDEVSTNNHDMVEDIQQITASTDKASIQSTEAAAATNEQAAALKEISQASQNLAHLAEGLQNSVIHFKI